MLNMLGGCCYYYFAAYDVVLRGVPLPDWCRLLSQRDQRSTLGGPVEELKLRRNRFGALVQFSLCVFGSLELWILAALPTCTALLCSWLVLACAAGEARVRSAVERRRFGPRRPRL